ncbi:MAG: 2'-5' RNA ligase [Deltaproteobacteria bacterium RIFCSPLOWO2_12_FULL_43_16]|nr:MAG: 2'-5' RNA ligase [Deltaproteobacteria bacterium GWA2_43_19]OGQ12427.1 MAG: 2'-5' RNA ligase [Deltaproteobacteria bacterium RIFCSPHIGHO2_02_FULL_43_33]OGQ40653.1 MAG: 2'-5' RNA ligase [Deltaproteobacteria bacterium RIFCSPLOWO2_01_FULL_42_9]OGQ59400.1 MAG: 2'-5' RNA ligase [Deltaproteobacteria bacterium RIFCSPLOWO2_12_FULL_43_16]HBR18047.1 RNA 2',3'-cyclic phosphodiesterase [Deltaproteobacteria bacterium]
MEQNRFVRAFIAIELPSIIVKSLGEIQDNLRDTTNKITWVKPDNIHLTMKFLGNIETDKAHAIEKILKNIVSQISIGKLSVEGVGAFPTINNPRVIWVGIEDDKNLLKIYTQLEDGLASLGFKKEDRPFKPHLTLGRVKFLKDKKGLKERLEKLADIKLASFIVDSLILFKSELTPEGSLYTKLKEVKLDRNN